MKLLTSFGVCPNVIKQKGNILLVIEIPEVFVRIVASNNYINGDEFELATFFNLTYIPHFFPYKLLSVQNLIDIEKHNYDLPDLEMYILETYDLKRISEIKYYHSLELKSAQLSSAKWSIQKELMIHSHLKLQLLTISMLHFMSECFEFQHKLQLNFKNDFLFRDDELEIMNQFVNPFNKPICSIGGLTFHIYGYNYQNYLSIHCVKNENGKNLKTVSRIEHKYASYMHFKEPNRKLLSAFSSDEGQKYFKEAIPDVFCEESKTAIFFQGCKFHGHFNNCLINPKASGKSKTPFGKSYEEVNNDFENQIKNLLLNNPDKINSATIVWECIFRKEMATSKPLIDFLDHHYVRHPLQRLRPRDAMRGAFIDTYACKWNYKKFPNETFFAIDVNGLYSYCAINNEFITGKYEVIMGTKLSNVVISYHKFYYCNKMITGGAIFVQILAPRSLEYPFLMYRKCDKTTVNTLCKKCAEDCSKTFCMHNHDERSLIGTYVISEIEFALKLGYKLLNIFEIHAYFSSENFLNPFVKELNRLKTKYSDCFENLTTLESKTTYCNELNIEMNLEGNEKFDIYSIQPNTVKRNFYKLASNSFFGKFSQRMDKANVVFVSSQQELEKLYHTQNIEDIFCLSDQICMAHTTSDSSKQYQNLKYNVYIGSQITAYARQEIYEKLMQITNLSNCTIYHVNCDSIFFSLTKDCPSPFRMNHSVGNFKDVVKGNILSYLTFGPRQYCLSYEKDSILVTETHICGLSIEQNLSNFDFQNLFSSFIENYENKLFNKFIFPQTRKKVNLKALTVKYYSDKFTLSNSMSTRRYICLESDRLKTFPYGYHPQMLDE